MSTENDKTEFQLEDEKLTDLLDKGTLTVECVEKTYLRMRTSLAERIFKAAYQTERVGVDNWNKARVIVIDEIERLQRIHRKCRDGKAITDTEIIEYGESLLDIERVLLVKSNVWLDMADQEDEFICLVKERDKLKAIIREYEKERFFNVLKLGLSGGLTINSSDCALIEKWSHAVECDDHDVVWALSKSLLDVIRSMVLNETSLKTKPKKSGRPSNNKEKFEMWAFSEIYKVQVAAAQFNKSDSAIKNARGYVDRLPAYKNSSESNKKEMAQAILDSRKMERCIAKRRGYLDQLAQLQQRYESGDISLDEWKNKFSPIWVELQKSTN